MGTAKLTRDQKEITGRATYYFICRLREERPEVWKKVKERAAENAAKEAVKLASPLPSAV